MLRPSSVPLYILVFIASSLSSPVKAWISWATGAFSMSLLDHHGPFPTASESFLYLSVPANIRHTLLFSFLYSLPSLFLSFPSCQDQLRSHPWKHSETLQLELIITSSALTVIVLPLIIALTTFCLTLWLFPSLSSFIIF